MNGLSAKKVAVVEVAIVERRCLVPRRLSLDENVRAQRKAGRRQRARLRLPSVHFPWSLAVHHQSFAFRARLHRHAKNEAPEEEGGRGGR